MKHIESEEQIALFQWAEFYKKIYPELELLYHCPNGGSRNVSEAARLKKEGVKAGVCDICLPTARNGYHGLYIEMKAPKGKLSEAQAWWISKLNQQNYKAVVCYSWLDASKIIMEYLG